MLINWKKIKRIIFFAIVALVVGAGYYAWNRYQEKENAINELTEFENIQADIFDAGDRFKAAKDIEGKITTDSNPRKIGSFTVEDLKNDNDFLYQVLIQNQLDLNRMNLRIDSLGLQLKRFESQAKLQKTIISYVNLREKVLNSQDYYDQMQNFKLLSIGNKVLMDKVRSLQEVAAGFKSFDQLSNKLKELSKTLIAMKKSDPSDGFIDKVKFNIAKIITVRRLDPLNKEIDGGIYRLQKALKEKDCRKSQDEIVKFDEKYKAAASTLRLNIEKSCELREVDDSIMLYLENLAIVN